MKLLALIKEDLAAHRGEWSRPGFQALLVHRLGNASRLMRRLMKIAHVLVRNFYGIELPFEAKIGRRVVFEHQHGIVVHGNCIIGDDCIIRQGVTLGMRRMDRPLDAPIIAAGVNVGAGAKILGKVTIGSYATIGANAVVLKDVAPGTLWVGVPARMVFNEKSD
jgi:serine acetyltransferase